MKVCPKPGSAGTGPSFGGKKRNGFTLVELLIVVAVMLTIAAMAVARFLAAKEAAQYAKAVSDIRTLGGQIVIYEIDHDGEAPDTLDDLGYGYLKDPWGNQYQYLNFANVHGNGQMRKDHFLVPINTSFDLYSMGPDGASVSPLTAKASRDDVIWAGDGAFVGKASDF